MFNYLLALTFFVVCEGTQWPIPYEPIDRPEIDPECKPLSRDFCKDGLPYGNFPIWWSDDTISLYALMQTKEELGDTVMQQKLTSYTLGLRSKNTGKNYTLSWEPLSKLNDTIAPRILPGDRIVWCNQAAACLRENKEGFKSFKSLPIGSISGEFIHKFEVWVKKRNNTMPFQYTLLNNNGITVFISSYDSIIFIAQAIYKLKDLGANLITELFTLNVYVVSSESTGKIGSEEYLRRTNPAVWEKVEDFYGILQATSNAEELEKKKTKFQNSLKNQIFFYFYNGEYWYLKVKKPYLSIVPVTFNV